MANEYKFEEIGGGSGGGGGSVELDTTLEKAGKAADAAAVGKAIDEVKNKQYDVWDNALHISFDGVSWTKACDLPTTNVSTGGTSGGSSSKPIDIFVKRNGIIQSVESFIAGTGIASAVRKYLFVTKPTNAELEIMHETTIDSNARGEYAHLYIAEDTGIAYIKVVLGGLAQAVAIGGMLFEDITKDRGWANDLSDMSADGVYCMRRTEEQHVLYLPYYYDSDALEMTEYQRNFIQAYFENSIIVVSMTGGYDTVVYKPFYREGTQFRYQCFRTDGEATVYNICVDMENNLIDVGGEMTTLVTE